MTELLDLLSLRSPHLKRNLVSALKFASGEDIERPKQDFEDELEKFYSLEGFQKTAPGQLYWTKVEIKKPASASSSSKGKEVSVAEKDEEFSISLSVAVPGHIETYVSIPVPWNEEGLEGASPEQMCRALSMAMEERLDEFADDSLDETQISVLKAIAREHVLVLEKEMEGLMVNSLMKPAGDSESIQKRVGEIKGEISNMLDEFGKSIAYIESKGSGKLADTTRLIEIMKDQVDGLGSLEILIPLRTYLDSVLFTGQMIRGSLVSDVPVDTSDDHVQATLQIEETILHHLNNLKGVTDKNRERVEVMKELVPKFTGALIISLLVDPSIYEAYQAGLSLDELLACRTTIEKSEGAMQSLIHEVSSMNQKISSIHDYRQSELLDRTRLNELMKKVRKDEEVDENLSLLLDRVDEVIAKRIRSVSQNIENINHAIESISRFAPLNEADRELVENVYYQLSQTKKEEFARNFEIMTEIHETIKRSLIEDGKLPDNFQSELEPQCEQCVANLLTLVSESDPWGENPKFFLQLMTQYLTGQLIFTNVQVFSDTFDAYGLDLSHYIKLHGEPSGRTERIFRSAVVPYSDPESVQEELGYYTVYERHNSDRLLLSKADWEPTELSDGDSGYFVKGVCHMGRAIFNDDDKTWGPIRKIDLELDLSALPLESQEKTEAYFKMMKICIEKNRDKALDVIRTESDTIDLFTGEELDLLIDHIYNYFDDVVFPAMYKTHYAILYPDEKIEGVTKNILDFFHH